MNEELSTTYISNYTAKGERFTTCALLSSIDFNYISTFALPRNEWLYDFIFT